MKLVSKHATLSIVCQALRELIPVPHSQAAIYLLCMDQNMSKYFKLLFLVTVGIYLTLHFTHQDEGWRARVNQATAKQKLSTEDKERYDLTSMVIMNRAVVYIEDHYVEPARIDRNKMVGAALEEIQRVVPEIMVNLELDDNSSPIAAEVQVNDHRARFTIKIGSRFALLFKLRDVFRFIQDNLRHFTDVREVEYAAINGMLSTLDPHSILLTPEEYAEMHLSTKGRFGGLGIVIGIRDNQLTVINPIEDTPASRAGIMANDRIVQINLDSTVNMSLSDAVGLMRGEPGTQVDIFVMREGWLSPKKFTLTRDNIKVRSVKWKDLGDGVGVVRVRNFQNTTVDELRSALRSLKISSKRSKLKGLVLDLRGNPGGLLDQAAKMSDLFISRGTIVKTVGSGDKLREPKMATSRGTITDLPIVVLLDAHSASASEIVAGALKNHQRALVLGQKSFGKGSVQLLFDNPDQSALKLTIAQYLTPGDISIQSVGITPTIELSPVLLTDEDTYFFGLPDEVRGEASLPEHLVSQRSEVSKSQKPLMTMRYLSDPELIKSQRDRPNEIIVDYELRFAKRLLALTKGHKHKQLIRAAEQLVSSEKAQQDEKIDQTLKPRSIQWLSKVTRARGKGKATVQLEPAGGKITAGETLQMTVTVRNTSRHPLHQVRGITKSENYLFKGHEFLFGFIPPGETRTWTEKIKVEASFIDREDQVEVVFNCEGRGEVPSVTTQARVVALPAPHFALRYEIDDHKTGNGDGLLNPGEEVQLFLSFRNEGKGASRELIGQLSNEGKGKIPALFIKQGRVTPEQQVLAPSEEGSIQFLFKVKEGWEEASTSVFLSLVDPKLRESTIDKIDLPLFTPDRLKKLKRTLSAKEGLSSLSIRSLPSATSALLSTVAQVKSDACVTKTSGQCQWYRVPLTADRFGWVSAKDVTTSTVKPAKSTPLELSYEVSPPKISISSPPLSVSEKTDRVTVEGQVESTRPLRDLMIFVNRKKVFFLPRTEMSNPKGVEFSADIPLEGGVNHVTIYARLSEEVSNSRSVFIFRPKSEETKKSKKSKKSRGK